jgi:hypothetical protein
LQFLNLHFSPVMYWRIYFLTCYIIILSYQYVIEFTFNTTVLYFWLDKEDHIVFFSVISLCELVLKRLWIQLLHPLQSFCLLTFILDLPEIVFTGHNFFGCFR